MSKPKKIDPNPNAKSSTDPRRAAGNKESAVEPTPSGMTPEKYLTLSESVEEFEAAYVARRRLYPPNDAIIDRLIGKITLAHVRVDRAFEAEAEMLDQSSLAEVLVRYDKPIKHLSGYEASNRRTLKLLEDELERYLSMLREPAKTDESDD
jgi:hypothetical protein